jgi:hypothetical protein
MTLGLPNAAINAAGAGRAGKGHYRMPVNCNRRLAREGIGDGVSIRVGIGIDCATTLGRTTCNFNIVIIGGGGG